MSEEVKTIEEAVELCLETKFIKDRNGFRIKRDPNSNLNSWAGGTAKGASHGSTRGPNYKTDWGKNDPSFAKGHNPHHKDEVMANIADRETAREQAGLDLQDHPVDFNSGGAEVPYYRESKEKLYNVLKNCFDEVNEILPKYKTSYKLVDEIERLLSGIKDRFISQIEARK